MRKIPFTIMFLALAYCFVPLKLTGQNKYFIDGYHGGIWGHYPTGYTTFIADQMDKNPFWKLNLEIEPITWDVVKENDRSGYNRFKQYVSDQSANGRVEFVNPSYGQCYLFNVQGESVIRQFGMGIRKIREHFPEATFRTYSSEEPCFTSALPQILKSFGFKYASLKNPNTCWGGYTSAYGGELVKWTGPDGSSLLTVPRYATEDFKSNSTWQTIAWNNAVEYIGGAREQGIENPIGMCLQDAGWKNGPWLGKPKDFEYKLWKDYISGTADQSKVETWKFSQENVQVSLVWGAQILQRLAKNVRHTENKLIMAEKIYAIQTASGTLKPKADLFKTAWENLLLAQHHDSWIVPYNIVDKVRKLNWADQVKIWTDNSNRLSDSVLKTVGVNALTKIDRNTSVRVYNTLGQNRSEVVSLPIEIENQTNWTVLDFEGKSVTTQMVIDTSGRPALLFSAVVPALGYSVYHIKKSRTNRAEPSTNGMRVERENHKYILQSELYRITIDPANGGTIGSLIGKQLNNKEFVNASATQRFNEMSGYFYEDSVFHSSTEQEAKVSIIESGPLRIKLRIDGFIAIHPFTQYLTVTQGEPRIDLQTKIYWQGNPGIGENYFQKKGWKQEQLKKAFYNDAYKLTACFPVNINNQQVYKNAAFDVVKSKLKNTFFSRWDSIKNNIIVNWVDINSDKGNLGMTLLTDHTTNYQHGENGVLGLTLQYSGMGLWGRNYNISGPSQFNYSLIPHKGEWNDAKIWEKSLAYNEPLQLCAVNGAGKSVVQKSLVSVSNPNIEISSIEMEDEAVLLRLFNASERPTTFNTEININAKHATLVELSGKTISQMNSIKGKKGTNLKLTIPPFGIRTIKLEL